MSTSADYLTAFQKQRPLTKAVVMAIKPGTLIEVKWQDSPNTVGILLEKPERERGDVSLRVWYPDDPVTGSLSHVDSHAVHGQVVAVHGKLEVAYKANAPTANLVK